MVRLAGQIASADKNPRPERMDHSKAPHMYQFLGLLCLLLAGAGSAIHAQSLPTDTQMAQNGPAPLRELSLEQLGKIEVTTASKTPEALWKTPAAIFVITNEDIRRSGATSIPEALRLAPGVEVGRIDANTWAIGIRGLQSNFSKSVLVLIDGRSVYTPLFSGVFWDVQDLPLEDVDRIEVIRGPGGTIWGPNAVNGVINIITKNSEDTHGALVSVLAGNVDKTIDTVRMGGGNGRGLNYRVFARGFDRGAQFHTDGNNFDGFHQERGGFRSDWNRNTTDTYTLQGDIYRGDSPHMVGLGSINPPTLGVQTVVDSAVSGGDLLARWRRDLGNGSDIYLQAYFDRTQRIDRSLGESRNTFDIDFVHRIRAGSRNQLSYGAGLRWSPYHIEPSQNADVEPHDDTDHIHSLFVQDEFQVVPNRVSITAGMKVQHNNFTGFDAQPSIRALWTPSEHQSFWAAVTRAVTTPSRLEEGFNLNGVASVNPLILVRVSGNPDFRSETLLGYEGGYRQLFSKSVYIDLAVFHNDYADLQSFGSPTVFTENTPPGPHTVIDIPYANQIAGATDGFEISPTWNVTSAWRIAGSYSFLTAGMHATGGVVDISSTGSIQTYEGSSPRQELELRSFLNLPFHFEFDPSYRYVSALPAQKVNAYQTMDARFGFNYRQFQFTVDGQNLFQPSHFEWGTGDPAQALIGIRRAVYGSIVWNSGR